MPLLFPLLYISVLSHPHPHVKYVLLAQTTNDSHEKVHPISEGSPNNRAIASYFKVMWPKIYMPHVQYLGESGGHASPSPPPLPTWDTPP